MTDGNTLPTWREIMALAGTLFASGTAVSWVMANTYFDKTIDRITIECKLTSDELAELQRQIDQINARLNASNRDIPE